MSTAFPEKAGHRFVFKHKSIDSLSAQDIARHAVSAFFDSYTVRQVNTESIAPDQGVFSCAADPYAFEEVSVVQQDGNTVLLCACEADPGKLCAHEALALTAILERDELRLFFDRDARHAKIRSTASDYGLEHENDLDRFFTVSLVNGKITVAPKNASLVPVTRESLRSMQSLLETKEGISPIHADEKTLVVLKQHRHYKHLQIELVRAQTTREGKIKNPLSTVSPLDLVWKTEDPAQLKFFSGVSHFQGASDTSANEAGLLALRAVVGNPCNYDFFVHDESRSGKLSASSIMPVKVKSLSSKLTLEVDRDGDFFDIRVRLSDGDRSYAPDALSLQLDYFVRAGQTLYLADNLQIPALFALIGKKEKLSVHHSRFWEFKVNVLQKLEEKLHIDYKYIAPATARQLEENGFGQAPRKLIFLSDFGSHVMIIPVVRYGDVEIQVRSRRQVYALDSKDTHSRAQFKSEFLVRRDDHLEQEFTRQILSTHPYLEEEEDNQLPYYYLHKGRFLDDDWFLEAFEYWRENGIAIYGFNELEGNKLDAHKPKIDIKVLSGINWFNAEIEVRFGRKKASLQHLHKAIRNKSKYVRLDDGTLGILPQEWMEKFTRYFNSGEIIDLKTIQIPKIRFSDISQLFEEEMLDAGTKGELRAYREKFSGFESIREIEVPETLKATLRPYQREGLNWLNFLDDFNFGGCLADDMGLGKTIQVIAFMLSQREKSTHNVNLLVVPATLIFNWQQEVARFAPSLKVLTLHGPERIKNTESFDGFEIVLTSYGTLLQDIRFLKEYHFNYVFLDESQNIRNPETERYKAVRLLSARNRIVMTGTPVENNTFDLYSQFSFACPGLLGSRQYFRDVYSSPVDQFENTRRTAELRDKIRPFLLRRTKQQVAAELPEKTEMILYCEMGTQQRNMYKAYEKEFREYISATTEDDLNKRSMNVLRGLTRLRQICDAPVLADELSGGIASAKIDLLTEQIESKAPEHKILVFSQFVSMLDLIARSLDSKNIRYTMLTGKTRNREAAVRQFQEDPQTRVFLISLKAGGTGLNLTEADYVYLVDPWWNPAVENQAIDRAHRIGQDKHVIAVRMICPDTVEEKILQLQESKRTLATELITEEPGFFRSLSRESLLGLLSDLK